jgi:hypothetical protein
VNDERVDERERRERERDRRRSAREFALGTNEWIPRSSDLGGI